MTLARTNPRRFRTWFAPVLLWTTWGCGDSPNRPQNIGLGLPEGRYSVSVIGFDLAADPRIQVCSPIGVPSAGKNMQTTVDLRQESSEWVAHSTTGAGDLVIRLRESGPSSGSTVPVLGSATGTALWSDTRFPSRDLRVRFDGIATASGDLTRGVSFINGQITGTIVFSNSGGETSTCPMVLWTLQPAR